MRWDGLWRGIPGSVIIKQSEIAGAVSGRDNQMPESLHAQAGVSKRSRVSFSLALPTS